MSDFNWSNAEKKVARQAFEAALRRELDSLMQEVRSRAAAIAEPAALWELEDYLAKRRRQMTAGMTIATRFCRWFLPVWYAMAFWPKRSLLDLRKTSGSLSWAWPAWRCPLDEFAWG